MPRWLFLLGALAALLGLTHPARAQQAERQNVYRYILDVEPPDPTGFIPLDLNPRRVYRATAPKPIAAAVLASAAAPESILIGVNLEASPYFLVGGGTRTLESYRDLSVKGRLLRVLTKTLLGAAVAYDPEVPGAARIGIGIRSTFHDPHDPTGAFYALPEHVDSLLAAAGVHPDANVEDVSDLGVDLRQTFADARRTVRGHCCVQVSGGWGFAATAAGGRLAGDSLGPSRHTLWVSTQWTLSPRLDLLVQLQGTNMFRDEWHQRVGLALQRKTTRADLLAELYYDSEFHRLFPGVTIEGSLGRGLALDGALLAESGGADAAARLRTALMLKWYLARGP
jgi:hypothetical protein